MTEPSIPTRRPFLRFGAALWVIGPLQFLVTHLIVQSAWGTPYRWSANNISDLGNVRCGTWGDTPRYVCSPLHSLMNASFTVQGVTLVLGGLLLWTCWRFTRASRTGRVLLILGSTGYLLAGLAPADANENLHVLGAVLLFLLGNLGLLLSGPALRRLPGPVRAFLFLPALGVLAGAVGLLGMVLFFRGEYLGLGMGGMERVTVFPLQVWTLLVGSAVLTSSPTSRPSARTRPGQG